MAAAQPESDEIQWSSVAVTNVMSIHLSKANTQVDNTDELVDALGTVGGLLSKHGQADKLASLRDATQRMLEARHSLQAHHDALYRMKEGGYVANGETTDFNALLQLHTSEIARERPYNAETDPLRQHFDAAVAGQAGNGEEQIDDDIAIEGDKGLAIARNRKCPITMRLVMELEDPVEDEVGYVYEKQAILQMLKGAGARGIKCPEAGTNHRVTEYQLKPAKKVLMAQKKAAKAAKRGMSKSVVEDSDDDDERITLDDD